MVLADADEVHPDPVGQLGLGHDVAEDAGLGLGPAGGVGSDIAEGVEAELDGCLDE
jgi:hypothetical protein